MNLEETLKNINQLTNVKKEIILNFNGIEKKAKLKKFISGYIIDNAIELLNSEETNHFEKFWAEIAEKLRKKNPEINNQMMWEYIGKHSDLPYTEKEARQWVLNEQKFIDKLSVKEKERTNTEVFKLIVDDLRHEDGNYDTKEIEMLHSSWDSEFWRSQDRESIGATVNSFRAKNQL